MMAQMFGPSMRQGSITLTQLGRLGRQTRARVCIFHFVKYYTMCSLREFEYISVTFQSALCLEDTREIHKLLLYMGAFPRPNNQKGSMRP